MEAPPLDDPRVFPADLDVAARRFAFLAIDESVLERSSFLDTRIEAPLAQAVPVPVAALAALRDPPRPPAFLWHTSFCCSTLLARALHLPPAVVALKEPLVLRRLSHAHDPGKPLGELPQLALRLLARPWAPGAAVLVKATHAALNIAAPLLGAVAAARGVVVLCAEKTALNILDHLQETYYQLWHGDFSVRCSGVAARKVLTHRISFLWLDQTLIAHRKRQWRLLVLFG